MSEKTKFFILTLVISTLFSALVSSIIFYVLYDSFKDEYLTGSKLNKGTIDNLYRNY